jgi:hypothetical protein
MFGHEFGAERIARQQNPFRNVSGFGPQMNTHVAFPP